LDPRNLRKIELVQISQSSEGKDGAGEPCSSSLAPECWNEDFVVAGGLNCVEDVNDITEDTPPCLSVDVSLQGEGSIRVVIDKVRFSIQLQAYDSTKTPEENLDGLDRQATGRYRMRIPGLEDVEHFADLDLDNPDDLAAYNRAFHDV